MKRRVVITTPHAFCEDHAAVLDHACDTVAVYAARGLGHHLRQAGLEVVYLEGDTNRRRLDLNRKTARHSPFHRRVTATLRPGDMLLDVHSFPGAADDPLMQAWGEHDLVLCAFDAVSREVCRATEQGCPTPTAPAWQGNAQESHSLAQALNQRGVATLVQYPPDDWGRPARPLRPHEHAYQEPALRHYYLIQRFGPLASPALMLEFDEDKGLTRMNYTLAVIGATIAQLFGHHRASVAGRVVGCGSSAAPNTYTYTQVALALREHCREGFIQPAGVNRVRLTIPPSASYSKCIPRQIGQWQVEVHHQTPSGPVVSRRYW